MKVEVKNEQEEKKMEFPCLLVNNKRTIILAAGITNDYTLDGIVIRNEYSGCGAYFNDYDKKEFRPFIGEITLSND